MNNKELLKKIPNTGDLISCSTGGSRLYYVLSSIIINNRLYLKIIDYHHPNNKLNCMISKYDYNLSSPWFKDLWFFKFNIIKAKND